MATPKPLRVPSWLKGVSIVLVLVVLCWEVVRSAFFPGIPKLVEIAYSFLAFAAAYVLLIDFHFSVSGRLEGLRVGVETSLANLQKRFDSTSTALLAIAQFDKRIVNVVQTGLGKKPEGPYLDWLLSRLTLLVQNIENGMLIASTPDYFGFASRIFEAAERDVVSTSKVDPGWYDSPACQAYIQLQQKLLVQGGKQYTRVFYCRDQDTPEKRKKLRDVILSHSSMGFRNVVVRTPEYANEIDCAMIDGGSLLMEAEVAVVSGHPMAEINGCVCYVNNKSLDANARLRADTIKGYIQALLETRAAGLFGPGTLTPEQANTLNKILDL